MNKTTGVLLILTIVSVLLYGCGAQEITEQSKTTTVEIEQGIQVTSEGVKYLVHPSKIRSGGPPQDGIPSIDRPKYVTVEEADDWIEDNELVLAIIYDGVKRVYPLQILVWHEIVNDVINDDKVLITYCPLCGSGIAFKPTLEVDGESVDSDFGTSGKLYNSNLVMYDRTTETYWTQIDGKAIVGELTGQQLEPVSIDTVVWRDWKVAHPESEVLSQQTGYVRNYGRDPYGSYYEDSNLFFPVENTDSTIHPKDVIFGINVDGVYAAYREVDLKQTPVIEDTVNGHNLQISRDDVGIVKIVDKDTGQEFVKERDFWFAWYAFHPDTLLYGVEPNQ